MPALFIFDLDGTLLDSIPDIAFSMNAVLERHGYPTHPERAFNQFVGNGVRLLVERALPESARTPGILQPFQEEYMAYYAQHACERTRPFEGVCGMLETLQGRGVLLSVASNKPHEVMDGVMRHYFPSVRFAAVFGHRRGYAVKPDPAIVFDILEKTGVAKKDVLYLGDTAVDMQTAQAAGVRSVGALWGYRTREELTAAGADFLAEKPQDLLTL